LNKERRAKNADLTSLEEGLEKKIRLVRRWESEIRRNSERAIITESRKRPSSRGLGKKRTTTGC